MPEFKDFWSRNGWLCQYQFSEGFITESNYITPLSKPPYSVCDRYNDWSVEELETWLQRLDDATYLTAVLPQPKAPSLDLRLFPAPDGNWYAAWPPMPENHPGQLYVRVCTFSPHPSWRTANWQEEIERNRLEKSQEYLASAARRIWRNIQRGN